MLATCNQTLWPAHTEGLLDLLTSAILRSCGQVETFSVRIKTSRYYMNVSEYGFDDCTTYEQWKVTVQLMALITRVTRGSGALRGVTLLIELNSSREFLPRLQEKNHQDGLDGALTISLNMLTPGTA